MSRDAKPAAWIVLALWLALAAVTMVIAWANRSVTSDLSSLDSADFVYVAGSTLFAGIYAGIGSLVVARRRHRIGWLLMAVALTVLAPLLCEQYAILGVVVHPGALPAPTHVLALSAVLFVLPFPALALILLLFPTGTPRSPRWRPLVASVPLAAMLTALWGLLPFTTAKEDVVSARGVIANPFGIPSAKGVLTGAVTVGVVLILLTSVGGVVSLVLRFRRSHGVERQQIKWLALVALVAGIVLAGNFFPIGLVTDSPRVTDAFGSIAWGALVTTVLLGLPLAIGASILRYRLYDIDRVISRTLSYAVVTTALAGVYALVTLVGPSAVLRTDDTPDWVIAGATLLVAAAFVPVRRRVQSVVDRRFNRARYDATRTIESFSARLREEIDIDALGAELEGVVGETMQPSTVSLWVRPGGPKR